jgi:hypothetical protein
MAGSAPGMPLPPKWRPLVPGESSAQKLTTLKGTKDTRWEIPFPPPNAPEVPLREASLSARDHLAVAYT